MKKTEKYTSVNASLSRMFKEKADVALFNRKEIEAIFKRLEPKQEGGSKIHIRPDDSIVYQLMLDSAAKGKKSNKDHTLISNSEALSIPWELVGIDRCSLNSLSAPYSFGAPLQKEFGTLAKFFPNENQAALLSQSRLDIPGKYWNSISQTKPSEGGISLGLALGRTPTRLGVLSHKAMEETVSGALGLPVIWESSEVSGQLGEFFLPIHSIKAAKGTTISVNAKVEIGNSNEPFFILDNSGPSSGFLQAFGSIELILYGPNGIRETKKQVFLDIITLAGTLRELSSTEREFSISTFFEVEENDLPWVIVSVIAKLVLIRWWFQVPGLPMSAEDRGGLGVINLLEEGGGESEPRVHPALNSAGPIKITSIGVKTCKPRFSDILATKI